MQPVKAFRNHAETLQLDLSPVAPDLALLQANRTWHTVTWIGHSTVRMQTGGRNLITDPMFSRRASPLPFAGPWRYQESLTKVAEELVAAINHAAAAEKENE